MKRTSLYIGSLLLFLGVTACTNDALNDDFSAIDNTKPEVTSGIFNISEDNSGKVRITPIGQGVAEFKVDPGYGEGEPLTLQPGESLVHVYPEGSYTVSIEAKGITGNTTQDSYPLEVTYRAPENIAITANASGYDVTVSAEADYAKGFLVFFGDDPNEEGTPLQPGETLEAHTYPGAGLYQIKVIALSGGAATSEKTLDLQVYDPYGFPVTFEDPNQNYNHGGTFGGVSTKFTDNPDPSGINTTARVWEYTKPAGAETWSGTWTPVQAPIDLAQGTKVKIWVYASETGKAINLELEWAVDGVVENGVAVLKVANTVANEWEELTFDFGAIDGLPADAKFTQYVFRYNDTEPGAGEVIYIDNIHQTN